jgi:16S rRNA (uracil1498-N3)-methyltransferase
VSRRRFLVPPEALRAEVVELHPEEAAHARRVLRLGVGEEVWLLDGAGTLARAELVEVGRQAVRARVLQRLRPEPPRPRLVLCLGLLKGPAMDLAVTKLTELAVDELRPFTSSRSVPRLKDAAARLSRWQRLAGQALKQCGAARPPQISAPEPLEELLPRAREDTMRLLLYEGASRPTLAQALASGPEVGEVWLVVGPEGGFAPQEVEAARRLGFRVVGLGPTVLRAETAAVVAAGLVRLGVVARA